MTFTRKRFIAVLRSGYDKLSQIDPRNDSQVIFYDQMIPGSVVMGYLNSDHWAIVVPIDRSHPFLSSTLANKNDFPREVLFEAIIRFVEEDLGDRAAQDLAATGGAL